MGGDIFHTVPVLFSVLSQTFSSQESPEKESLNTRSKCPAAGKKLMVRQRSCPRDGSTFKGKCRNCDPHRLMYPAVELFTGAMWLLITVLTGANLIPSPSLLDCTSHDAFYRPAMIDFRTPSPCRTNFVATFTIVAFLQSSHKYCMKLSAQACSPPTRR